MKRDYTELLPFLPEWPQTASMATLAQLSGWNTREVRQGILDARKAGYLVGSGQKGYFRPSCPEDLLRFYRSRRQRALSALASLTPTRRALKAAGFDIAEVEGRNGKGKAEIRL